MPADPQDLDVVDHPTLGTLKFPKDMPFDERNQSIERALLKRPDLQAPPGVPAPKQEVKGTVIHEFGERLRNAPNPGSFEGHPENIGEWVPASAGEMAGGVSDISEGNVAKGAHRIIGGTGNLLLPITPFVAAAAPIPTARAIAGGYLGGKMARGISTAVGATPDQSDLAEDVGNLAGGGVGLKAPDMAMSAARKVLPKLASNPIAIDTVGMASPRLAHVLRLGGRMGKAISIDRPNAVPIEAPQLEPPMSPAAEHLQNRIQVERGLRAQEPFPRRSEGLPEVEEGQGAATAHLHKAIQPNEMGNARMELTPRRVPGEIAPEAIRPRAFPARTPQPIPTRPGLMLKGEVLDTRPAKIGNLLNQATGGKPLAPAIPLRQQLERMPVAPKESSVVKSHSYDPGKNELTITTHNGQTYKYADVNADQAAEFANGSKGQAWNRLKQSGSVLIEKNGKSVTPTGSKTANPNDLTPILKESVRRAKAKK